MPVEKCEFFKEPHQKNLNPIEIKHNFCWFCWYYQEFAVLVDFVDFQEFGPFFELGSLHLPGFKNGMAILPLIKWLNYHSIIGFSAGSCAFAWFTILITERWKCHSRAILRQVVLAVRRRSCVLSFLTWVVWSRALKIVCSFRRCHFLNRETAVLLPKPSKWTQFFWNRWSDQTKNETAKLAFIKPSKWSGP